MTLVTGKQAIGCPLPESRDPDRCGATLSKHSIIVFEDKYLGGYVSRRSSTMLTFLHSSKFLYSKSPCNLLQSPLLRSCTYICWRRMLPIKRAEAVVCFSHNLQAPPLTPLAIDRNSKCTSDSMKNRTGGKASLGQQGELHPLGGLPSPHSNTKDSRRTSSLSNTKR